MTTLTVEDIIKFLNTLPKDMKVYMSGDEEGNDYHDIDNRNSMSVYEEDNVLIIFPNGLVEIDEILPIYMKEVE